MMKRRRWKIRKHVEVEADHLLLLLKKTTCKQRNRNDHINIHHKRESVPYSQITFFFFGRWGWREGQQQKPVFLLFGVGFFSVISLKDWNCLDTDLHFEKQEQGCVRSPTSCSTVPSSAERRREEKLLQPPRGLQSLQVNYKPNIFYQRTIKPWKTQNTINF